MLLVYLVNKNLMEVKRPLSKQLIIFYYNNNVIIISINFIFINRNNNNNISFLFNLFLCNLFYNIVFI